MTTPPDLPARLRLACDSCGEAYGAWRWRCICGEPLGFAADPVPSAATPDDADLDCRDGLWAFNDSLPTKPRASLDERVTPLIDAAEWGASSKLEYVFPSGPFKNRGATTMLSLASELGVGRIVEDSSGSAGATIAACATCAGINAGIYVPASVKPSEVYAIERAGTKPVRTEGFGQVVTDTCVEAVKVDDT